MQSQKNPGSLEGRPWLLQDAEECPADIKGKHKKKLRFQQKFQPNQVHRERHHPRIETILV